MLGNLKFSTDTGGDRTSSLTFYLRSVEEPLTPAGKEYKGKIQFEFTKGSQQDQTKRKAGGEYEKTKKSYLKRMFLSADRFGVSVQAQAASGSMDHKTTVSYTKSMDDGTENMTSIPTKTVKTGDDSPVTLYFSLMITSALLLLLILIADRKRREKEEEAF